MSLTSLRRLGVALVVCSSLTLVGCKANPAEQPVADEPTPSATPEPQPAIWPLTGLEAKAGQSVQRDRPIIVVKIDNTASASPQLGLGQADMVVEEMVEGGATRLAAFFYSELPEVAGPVRSMRASDIGIVTPVKADIITSGAAPVTVNRIRGAKITFFEEGAKGFFRESSRYAPYNLMVRPRETATLTKIKPTVAPSYFQYGDPAALPSGAKASSITVPFGMQTTRWTYRAGTYRNETSLADPDNEFKPDTVLVLKVPMGDAGYLDPAGNSVPETKFTGSGQALLFHQGRVVKGKWTKSSLTAPLMLSTKSGAELLMPPGHTWMELAPEDNEITWTK